MMRCGGCFQGSFRISLLEFKGSRTGFLVWNDILRLGFTVIVLGLRIIQKLGVYMCTVIRDFMLWGFSDPEVF